MSSFIIDGQGPYIKVAPGESRDYSLDWTVFLVALGAVPVDQILTSTWNVPAGLVAGPSAVNLPSNITTQWIASPTVGTYFVTNTITTVNGRVFPRGFRLIVTGNI